MKKFEIFAKNLKYFHKNPMRSKNIFLRIINPFPNSFFVELFLPSICWSSSPSCYLREKGRKKEREEERKRKNEQERTCLDQCFSLSGPLFVQVIQLQNTVSSNFFSLTFSLSLSFNFFSLTFSLSLSFIAGLFSPNFLPFQSEHS